MVGGDWFGPLFHETADCLWKCRLNLRALFIFQKFNCLCVEVALRLHMVVVQIASLLEQ